MTTTATQFERREDVKAKIIGKGLKFVDVARRCGVTNKHLSDVLSGRARLTDRLARDISMATGIPLREIVAEPDEAKAFGQPQEAGA